MTESKSYKDNPTIPFNEIKKGNKYFYIGDKYNGPVEGFMKTSTNDAWMVYILDETDLHNTYKDIYITRGDYQDGKMHKLYELKYKPPPLDATILYLSALSSPSSA